MQGPDSLQAALSLPRRRAVLHVLECDAQDSGLLEGCWLQRGLRPQVQLLCQMVTVPIEDFWL